MGPLNSVEQTHTLSPRGSLFGNNPFSRYEQTSGHRQTHQILKRGWFYASGCPPYPCIRSTTLAVLPEANSAKAVGASSRGYVWETRS